MDIWKTRKHQCPNRCDGILKVENVHRIVRNMVEEVLIKCKYWNNGCERVFKVGELRHHRDQCDFCPL
jgi:hypothetical protein